MARPAAGTAKQRRGYRGVPRSVREVLTGMQLVATAGRQTVYDRWDDLLPPHLRGHVRPLRWEHATLWLMVDGPVWAQEVRMLAPGLLVKLNAVSGGNAVTELKTKVVPPR